MPRVEIMQDNLNEANRGFAHAPLTQPVFLNSVPKSGSHLLRNVMRMFVAVEQQYDVQFIQWANFREHLDAWRSPKNYISWGHLFFADASGIELARVRKVLLVRDPYDWVLARARFFLSEQFQGDLEHLKKGLLSVEELLNLMIFGIYKKAPSLADIYRHNAAAWLGTDIYLVRYEDLTARIRELDAEESERFFIGLLEACDIAMPGDWRERVRIGSDRRQSGTARETLTGQRIAIPRDLPETQKRLVDYAAPGLRALLGYE